MATTMERDSKGRFKGGRNSNDNGNGNGRSLGVLGAAAAGGAALGVLAMMARKAAVQAPSALASDWCEALALEHKAVLKIFDNLEATDENATVKRNLMLAQLKHALAKHDVEEGNVIYPALREAGFEERTEELIHDHGMVKQYLYRLETTPSNSPEWIATVREFRSAIETHMQEEETDLFPKLRSKLSDEKNKALAATMNKEGFKVA